ncbi:hypothetical protein GCM10027578_17830 [Spirosoma luteolum]
MVEVGVPADQGNDGRCVVAIGNDEAQRRATGKPFTHFARVVTPDNDAGRFREGVQATCR